MNVAEVLPDSRLANPKGLREHRGIMWEPIFCANCGADGGHVPEAEHNFAFYLCPPCFETHGAIAGTHAIPDEVFWQQVNAAQLEKYGRILSPPEIVEALKDPQHMLSKLAKDRPCR